MNNNKVQESYWRSLCDSDRKLAGNGLQNVCVEGVGEGAQGGGVQSDRCATGKIKAKLAGRF